MDFDWAHGLPIGIVMFVGMFVGALLRRVRRARAHRNYPALAEELGLRFQPPANPSGLGRLRGDYRGHDVLVQADEGARIVVWLATHPQVNLHNHAYFKRTPEGLVSFSLGSRKLDDWLPNRYCAPGMEEMGDSAALRKLLGELQLFPKLKQLNVDPERLECVFDYGRPPFIPVGDLTRLLPLCADLAAEVERYARADHAAESAEPAGAH
jgi:hypothetical protein